MHIRNLLILAGFGLATSGEAATVNEVTLTRDGKTLVAEADFIVDVSRDEVVRAFTSFDQLEKINPAILSSHAESTGHNRFKVTTRMSDCVALFCRSLTLVELVSIDGDGNIVAEIDPSGSDFKAGRTEWTFESLGSQTRVTYKSAMRPDFWMPPLVGPRAMRKALRRQIAASVQNLESLQTMGRTVN